MGVDYSQLHDPNAEYTMRDLSSETMGVTRERGGGRDIEITDIQTTMVDGISRGPSSESTRMRESSAPVKPTGEPARRN